MEFLHQCSLVWLFPFKILTTILIVDVVFGLIGNCVALWIFCFRLKSWNPNTIFLFNLVIADFMVLVSLPLYIHSLVQSFWVFGEVLCRINYFLMFTNRSASIAMMTVVAIYRYFKVVHPHSPVTRLSRRHALLLSVLVWTLVIAPRVPLLIFDRTIVIENQSYCILFGSNDKSSSALVNSHLVFTVLEFVVPFLILVFCCVRISMVLRARTMGRPEKGRKAMRVCVMVVAAFVVCFLPTSITTVGIRVSQTLELCHGFHAFFQLNVISLGLNFLNSALDPVLYVFSSSVFRRELVKCLPQWVKCRKEDSNDSESGTVESQTTNHLELGSVSAGAVKESSEDSP